MHLVVGTAGHIDHGKTALIKALTGTDTDRLPEEKQRGITIDLGFAEMESDDLRIGFVDVPGHERFVKNMLAGASGTDLVLLVIAADEGVMPQTREHFDICRLLGIKSGIVGLTKKDLADDELIELVRLDIDELVTSTFLERAPVIAVSSKTGEGIDELRSALAAAARSTPARTDDLIARLPIDRSFAVKGFGTVVTGTLVSGSVSEGDELELLPAGRKVRVRNIQTHGRAVANADAGQRAAINLGGIDYAEVGRGMTLSEPGILTPSQIFDASVEVLYTAARPLKDRQRVRLHIGTAEVLARLAILGASEIVPGNTGFAQLRIESPIAAITGERFILRTYSPQMTVAGGTILRPAAKKPRRLEAPQYAEFLHRLKASLGGHPKTLTLLIETSGQAGMSVPDIQAVTGLKPAAIDAAFNSVKNSGRVIDAGGVFLDAQTFEDLKSSVVSELAAHHKREPLSRGLPLETLRERLFKYVRPEISRVVVDDLTKNGNIVIDKDLVRLGSHRTELSPKEKTAADEIRSIYRAAKLQSPPLDEVFSQVASSAALDRTAARKVFQLFLDSGEIVNIGEDYYILSAELGALVSRVRAFAESTPERAIDVGAFKDLGGISRKFAIPLLEYFDREKITRRAGDKRIVL